MYVLALQNGKAPVMYVQSNCNVASDRTRYVEELMKHIGGLEQHYSLPP